MKIQEPNFVSINFRNCKKNKSKTVLILPVFYFLNPELRVLVTKNKETLERYKGLVQY